MRIVALLLILLNVLFFIWSQLIDARVSPMDRAQPTVEQAPRIVLAREVQPAPEEEEPGSRGDVVAPVKPPSVAPLASESSAAVGPGADALACTSVGPFPDLPQTAQALSALRGAGFDPRQRVEQGELWVGYWVSIEGLPRRADADAAIRTLSQNGVTDVYLMPETEQGHVVSLGVFSDYQRAQRRAEQVRSLGLGPRISDRKRPGSVYWVDVDLPEPGQPLDLSLLQTGAGKITRLELRACPQSG